MGLASRVCSSSVDSSRVLFKGYFNQDEFGSDFDTSLLVKVVKSVPELRECIIGAPDLFKDASALPIDADDIVALAQLLHLMDKSVIVSRTLAIMNISRSIKSWEETVTQHNLARPASTVRRIRRRAVQNVARPKVLEEHSRKLLARAKVSNIESAIKTEPSTMIFDNAPDVLPKHVLFDLESKVASSLKLTLTKVPFEKAVPKDGRSHTAKLNGSMEQTHSSMAGRPR